MTDDNFTVVYSNEKAQQFLNRTALNGQSSLDFFPEMEDRM
ncbi:hypothetical protein ABFG93_06725 [Pseudalkalibacillus hwajinpoensis]